MRRLMTSMLVVLLLPIVLGACGGGGGGGSKVSAGQYVGDLCRSLKTWRNAIQGRVSDLTSSISSSTTPEQGKQKLRDYLDGVLTDTDQMLSRIKDAGVPDVANGKSTADTLVSTLQLARDSLANARAQVDNLPTSSRQAFGRATQGLARQIQYLGTTVQASLAGLQSASELNQAFNSSSACKAFG
jgi:hypothetical protein